MLSSELLFLSAFPTGLRRTAQSAAAEIPRQSAPLVSAGLLAAEGGADACNAGRFPAPFPAELAGFAPPDLRKSGGGGGGGAGGALVGFDEEACVVS